MKNNKNDVNKFWDGFRKSVIKYGVSESEADLYVKWGEKFAISIKGKPLRQRTGEDVLSFISKLRNDKRTQKWQVDQARKALYILYYKHLKIPLDIDESKKSSLEMAHEGSKEKEIFRDNLSTKKEFEKSNKGLIKKIKREIRYRHYSIRTEQSYLDWVIRFLTFHEGAPAETLTHDDIRRYLDYLAINRKVAASTQNQALSAIVFLYTQVL